MHVRRQLPKLTILCQGDAQLSELTRRFVAEEQASLFGTLSLWQGVDVPGATCQLVIIDRIPFPRPDEPLTMARQRAVAEAGGNGFMTVAATHAALLLAQGSGRLIRRLTDRGVVAVLDPRLVTARYGAFLQASMPDMWPTTDREVAIAALRRLAGQLEPAGARPPRCATDVGDTVVARLRDIPTPGLRGRDHRAAAAGHSGRCRPVGAPAVLASHHAAMGGRRPGARDSCWCRCWASGEPRTTCSPFAEQHGDEVLLGADDRHLDFRCAVAVDRAAACSGSPRPCACTAGGAGRTFCRSGASSPGGPGHDPVGGAESDRRVIHLIEIAGC